MFTITTPAILFPATTLILLAYTAKLVHIGGLVRLLKGRFLVDKDPEVLKEMRNLYKRIYLIRNMQAFGVGCLLFSSVCMIFLFANQLDAAGICFSISLLMLLCSLFLCFREIQISATALKIELRGIGEEH